MCLFMTISMAASAQALIKFDEVTHDFGKFPSTKPEQVWNFTFTNAGDKPLKINQAVASCGCTVPTYPKEPILPGQKGVITVKYNGKNMMPSRFKKSITVRTNGSVELTRLYITGEMTE